MTITMHLTVSRWGYPLLVGVAILALAWALEGIGIRRGMRRLTAVGNWIFGVGEVVLAVLAVAALLRLGFLR